MRDLFFYGTLRDLGVLEAVLGHDLSGIKLRDAVLPGFEVCAVEGQDFPFGRWMDGAEATGLLVSDLSEDDVARLDYYEGAYLYELQQARVLCDGVEHPAEVFASDHPGWTPAGEWVLSAWMARNSALAIEAAHEVMSYFTTRPATEVMPHYGTIRVRAQSRLHAKARKVGRLSTPAGTHHVEVIATRRPYLNFFTLEEHDLRFRRFDGTMSETVERAVFKTADAVTVLPYDPTLDAVLLIEQFRAGPFGRGDPHPWCIEAVAGRVDAGETYEETARRELMEEAGLPVRKLEPVGGYYPSPGACSEYLASFVALADLSDFDGRIGGVASEHEDIRYLVVPFNRLMQALNDHEIDNAPLMISAFWLAANRARMREGARA